MEESFGKLQKDGKNDVDNLVKWMKEAKVLDESKESEDKARKVFADSGSDAKNVTLDKFKEVIAKLASDQSKSADEFLTQLSAKGADMLKSVLASATGAASSLGGALASALGNRKTDNVQPKIHCYIEHGMDEAFRRLERDGKNNVDNLVLWMKESKVIDNSKDAEDKARKLLADTSRQQTVELEKFKEVIAKLAASQQRSIEEFTRQLSEHGEGVLRQALDSAHQAMSDAITNLKKR